MNFSRLEQGDANFSFALRLRKMAAPMGFFPSMNDET